MVSSHYPYLTTHPRTPRYLDAKVKTAHKHKVELDETTNIINKREYEMARFQYIYRLNIISAQKVSESDMTRGWQRAAASGGKRRHSAAPPGGGGRSGGGGGAAAAPAAVAAAASLLLL